jgi:NAD(P)H-hydrate epimerase
VPIVSIDIPSGMSADTCDIIGDSIEATVTVTLAAPKLPLVLPPAEMKAGEVVIADIGIPSDVIDQLEGPRIDLLTREQMRALIQPRAPDAHKGDFGRVLVVAGSMGKAGAAVLCAQGAMRAGAGLVTVAAPKSCQATIAAHAAEYMTEGLDETADGTVHFSAADAVLGIDADVIVAGPGLGRGEAVTTFVRELLDKCEGRSCSMPMRSTRLPTSPPSSSDAKAATSSSRRTRVKWRDWSAARLKISRPIASGSPPISPSVTSSTWCSRATGRSSSRRMRKCS